MVSRHREARQETVNIDILYNGQAGHSVGHGLLDQLHGGHGQQRLLVDLGEEDVQGLPGVVQAGEAMWTDQTKY